MKYIILVFGFLILTNFFGAVAFPKVLILGGLFAFSFPKLSKKSTFRNIIILILLGLVASMISSQVFRGQSFIDSLKASTFYFNILFYFILLKQAPSITQVEKGIRILTILFIGAYLLQYLIYPTILFSGADREFSGDVRIRLAGQGIVSLGYFYFVNSFLTNAKNKWFNLFFAIASLGVIFLMGFRTMLAGIFFFTLVMVIQVYGFSRKLLFQSIFILILGVMLFQIPVFNQVLTTMEERQKTDNFSNSDYVRVLQWQYYTTSHFKSPVEFFFGSGSPFRPESATGSGGSAYGKYMENLVDAKLNWVDLGFISTSWVVGILTVVFMITMGIIVLRKRLTVQYKYLHMWYLYLIVISFTTIEYVRPGNFEVHAIALYAIVAIQRNQINKKTLRIEKS